MCNGNRPAVTTAQSPFDDANGDIILHTSDHVDFRVFRLILTLSSSFFQGMFALPQPSDTPAHANTISHSDQHVAVYKHVLDSPSPSPSPSPSSPPSSIDVSEDSHTLDTLLRFLYPNTHAPPFRNITHARNVALIASKYDMPVALDKIADKVQAQYVASHPLHVYFLACQMGWKHVACAAARHALDTTLVPLPPGDDGGLLRFPDAGLAYHRLETYRALCCRAVERRLDNLNLRLDDTPKSCWLSEDEDGDGDGDGGISSQCLSRWMAQYLVNTKLAVFKSPGKNALKNESVVPEGDCTRCYIDKANAIATARLKVVYEIEDALSQVKLRFS